MKLSILIEFLVISVCGGEFGEGVFTDFDPRYYEDLIMLSPPGDENFKRAASRMGFKVYNYPTDMSFGISDTIDIARTYPNVIHLQISIEDLYSDYNTYQTFSHSNLLCATDCYNNNLTDSKTRLVSDTIFNYIRLIQVIQSQDFELGDYIQICLPHNAPNTQTNLIFEQRLDWNLKFSYDCATDEFEDSMLALITNEPLQVDSLLPTIFYQTPYILPEVKDSFPNSLSLITTWQPIKYAFKELLMHMGWYRVAILSDDSEYSLDFLEELVPLFIKEGITFTDQRCSGKLCDFTFPLNFLLKEDAKIIILNIDKRNAEKLVHTVENLQMVTWIVRDWPFAKLRKVKSNMFSITLSPVFDEKDKYYPHLSSITEGIRIIDRIYKNVFGDREKFQREFAKEATRPMNYQTNAYITLRRFAKEPTLVASMTIEGDTVNVFQHTDSYHNHGQPDSSEQCIVRSRNFFKPCSHEELLLFLGVCVMFALSMLVVVLFFNMFRKSRFYNRFP